MNYFVGLLILVGVVAGKPPEPRVVGGNDADPHEFPYQISLQWNFNDGITPTRHICGGSILNEYWILTAAHCKLDGTSNGYMQVVAGEHNLTKPERTRQIRRSVLFKLHSKFTGEVRPYDIGLIKIDKPLVFNKNVQPVTLPVAGSVPRGDAILTGWGSTSRTLTPEFPDALQKAVLPIIPVSVCNKSHDGYIHRTNVCAGDMIGTTSACRGDSGGPLVQYKHGNHPVQIGIVSWGNIPCAVKNKPAVFTKVSSFIAWIQMTMTMYS